jgi:succinate dehydrogenase/fumarate reductase-like Fe-S protein
MANNFIERYKITENKNQFKRWAHLKSQGKAVRSFEGERIANCWLSCPNTLKPSKQITALKFRAKCGGG